MNVHFWNKCDKLNNWEYMNPYLVVFENVTCYREMAWNPPIHRFSKENIVIILCQLLAKSTEMAL